MILTHPIKFGFTRDANVDLGLGNDVGLTYTVSDSDLLTVDVAGIVGVVADVAQTVEAFIYAHDTNDVLRAVLDIQICPVAFDISAYIAPDGKGKSALIKVAYPEVLP
jgi:hypothetical protein